MNFLFCLKTREMHGRYNLGPEEMFSRTKGDFLSKYS